jgi:hypothetical protein
MNKTTLPGVTISQVKRTHGMFMYLWPFQSCRELLSAMGLLAVCLPIMGTIVYLLDPAALEPVLIGAVIGSFCCGVYPLLPARLTLATRSEARHITSDLQARLIKLGYVASDQQPRPDRFHYRSKRSRFWRWDEQDIELLVHDHELVLNGPVAVLALLRARLLPPEDFAYLNKA